nr:nicotinate phosphoribosyltransferase [Clostridia bacterium]
NYEIFDPTAVWKRKKLTNFTAKNIRVQLFDKGHCVYECPDIKTIKKYCQEQIETLWTESLRFENPQTYYVDLSQNLYDLKMNLLSNPQYEIVQE